MAHAAAFDVWLASANTVYQGVPFGVVTDWAQQGRLSPDDKIRPAGTNTAWVRAADHDTVGDYLFVRQTGAAPATALPAKAHEELEPIEMDVGWKKSLGDDDDDPDMIPLIDISLVLLIFFMMTSAVASLSPINVPELKYPGELSADSEAFTIVIDKKPTGEAFYAIRVGEKAPDKSESDIATLEECIAKFEAKLNQVLGAGGKPPEVRIACHKELPSERVHQLTKDLERLKTAGKINYYGAEVTEKK